VVVDGEQIIGDLQQRRAQAAIGGADHSPFAVDLVALVTAGKQSRPSGQRVRIRIVGYGACLAGELGRRDHIDCRNGHEQHVGSTCQERGDIELQGLNQAFFCESVIIQVADDALLNRAFGLGWNGLLGPGHDLVDGALLEALTGIAQELRNGGRSELPDRLRGGEAACQRHCDLRLPEFVGVEQRGHSRECGLEMLADLALDRRRFADQIPAMPDQQAQTQIGRIERLLDQAEADDGSAVNSAQVIVVGLVLRMLGLAELARSEGVDDAGFESRIAKSALHGTMIVARALDRDEHVAELMLFDRVPQRIDHGPERRPRVFHRRRRHEHSPVKITQHPLRAMLGAVHRDDSEPLGADGLDALVQDAVRLMKMNL